MQIYLLLLSCMGGTIIFDRSHKHNDKLVCTAVLAAKCSRGGRPSAGDALCLFV